jgi:UDP-N-acetylglucosamine 2-epimerase (non-hydrolysing)
MLKILTVIGTRPEAIKLAPVVLELKRRPGEFLSRVCATAQHREMLDQVLSVFGIVPDHDLDLMSHAQSLAQITARAVEGLNQIIARENPDVVLVQGDTTTAFCGALAAYYQKKKVGHVEAGLRTGNKFAPFPEEINRRLVGALTDYHFAPTDHARAALLAEGVLSSSVFVTGNTVIDALLWVRERVHREAPDLPAGLAEAIDGNQVILVTGHRRESFGDGFENICGAIREVADASPNVLFIYPVHLNPNVQEPVNRILGGHARIRLIEPQPYLPFVWLMDRATIVLTDSGGVQEEAPSLGKPVLVMRETTERPEGIAAGNARLVGVQKGKIVGELLRLLNHPEERMAMAAARNPYGDGHAAGRIVEALLHASQIANAKRTTHESCLQSRGDFTGSPPLKVNLP